MFLDTIPDPNFKINTAGIEDAGGAAGPGFVTMNVRLRSPIGKNNSIKGRTTLSARTRPLWQLDIRYNPLTQVEFAPVYNFTTEKRGSLKPFYVSVPQYKAPKDATFAAFVTGTTITSGITEVAGSSSLEITNAAWSTNTYGSGLPKAGDIFTITDSTDSLHTQVYMISHIDTYAVNDTLPTSGSIRLHFFPGLQRGTPSGSTITFDNPLFRVTQTQDIQEYELGNDNLYTFSLKLEEALY